MDKIWSDEVDFAVTLCDTEGNITYMNKVSEETFSKNSAQNLIGQSLFECHPEAASEKIESLLLSKSKNVYTIEKNGKKKIIYQCPYFECGEFKGLVEISLVMPENMLHRIRN
jgi:transcriptional regulator with PAS, ATPase and Fis domain